MPSPYQLFYSKKEPFRFFLGIEQNYPLVQSKVLAVPKDTSCSNRAGTGACPYLSARYKYGPLLPLPQLLQEVEPVRRHGEAAPEREVVRRGVLARRIEVYPPDARVAQVTEGRHHHARAQALAA